MKGNYTKEQRTFQWALSNSCGRFYPEVFIQDGWCVGTDGHHLLRIRQSLLPGCEDLYLSKSTPDVQSVLSEGSNTLKEITYKEVLKKVSEIPLREEIPCPECLSDGEVEFEYTSKTGEIYRRMEYCTVCGGCGEIKPDFPEKDKSYPVRIGFMLMTAKELIWLKEIMTGMNIESIALQVLSQKGAQLKYGENLEIFIAGAWMGEEYLEEHHPICLCDDITIMS